MKRAFLFITALLALIAFPAAVRAAIPEPTEYFYVNDFAGVLSDKTAQHIIDVNDDLYARTGAQIVVTTVEFTDGSDMEKYSYDMFNKWKIGGNGNGILLLLSTGDQKFWVQRGWDLDVKLSAGEIGEILGGSFETDFDAGKYDDAVMGAFDAFVSKIERLYANQNQPAAQGGLEPVYTDYGMSETSFTNAAEGVWSVFGSFFFVVIIIIFASMFLSAIFGRGRRYYGGGVGYPRRSFFWGWGLGRYGHHHHHPSHYNHRPGGMGGPGPGPGGMGGQQHRPSSPPPRAGGSGFTFGGGVGRSGGFGGGSRPGGMGGFGGGGRSGGGGFTRGGGVGRK